MSEFYRISSPRASKPYRCEEAGCAIAKGERYTRHDGKQEGEIFTVVICERCQAMWDAWWETFGPWLADEGPTFGDLRTEIREETGRDPEVWLDEYLARKAAQRELQAILGDAIKTYQGSLPPTPTSGEAP